MFGVAPAMLTVLALLLLVGVDTLFPCFEVAFPPAAHLPFEVFGVDRAILTALPLTLVVGVDTAVLPCFDVALPLA